MYDMKRIGELAGIPSLNNSSNVKESAPPGMEELVLKLKQKFPGHEEKAFATAWNIYNKKKQHNESADEFASVPTPHNEIDSINMDVPLLIRMLEFAKEDARDDIELHKAAEALIKLASDGNTLDMNDYNDIVGDVGVEDNELEEADINNGYDDRHEADEFGKYPGFGFPTGADSPVTKKTGPSGARQGDNPEQKKMAVSEDTYKEMVYKYRSHLKESNNLPALSVSLEDYDPSLCRNDGETVNYVGDVTVTGKGLTKFGRIVGISYGILLHAYGDIVRENEESPETFNSETDRIKYTHGTSMHVDNITVHSVELDRNTDFQINDNSFAADEAEGVLDKSTIAMIKSPDTYRGIAGQILSKSVE